MRLSILTMTVGLAVMLVAGSGVALEEFAEIATGAAQSAADGALNFTTSLSSDAQAKADTVTNVALNVTSNLAGQTNGAVELAVALAQDAPADADAKARAIGAVGTWFANGIVLAAWQVTEIERTAVGNVTEMPDCVALYGPEPCANFLVNSLVEA